MTRVTVFGAARSGVAAANFLAARGVDVAITDSKSESELPLTALLDRRVKKFFGSHPEQLILRIDEIVLSPGIPRAIPILQRAAKAGIPIISEIELASRYLKGTVIAITGSNGKSTTTVLIGEILKAAGREPIVAGNIGDPLVSSLADEPRTYVIELSSFQLETVDHFRADVALLLNITPDHMDRYDTMDDYAAAKVRVLRNQRAADFAIVNAEDARTVNPPTAARVLRFSSAHPVEDGAYFDGTDLVLVREGSERRIPRARLALTGIANVENALASWLAADAVGVEVGAVESAFASFKGLPHRMVLVRELEGVRYINDSKGTNVDATVKSLEGMDDRRVFLILGGKDKAGEFERLRDLVTAKTRAVLTIGSSAKRIAEALEGAGEIVECGDMQRAIAYAREHASPGDTVLLSPACASFDQYQNFEHRGRHFEEIVGGLS